MRGRRAASVETGLGGDFPAFHLARGVPFMGFVPCFEACGFVKDGTAGSRRHVMRLKRDGTEEGP